VRACGVRACGVRACGVRAYVVSTVWGEMVCDPHGRSLVTSLLAAV